jgi:hypothetical protein
VTEAQIAVIEAASVPGRSQTEIAQIAGVSQQAVSKTLSKPDIKGMIEGVQTGFITANARRAAGNITQIIHSTRAEDKELRLKYSAEVARGIGILPTQTQSVFVQNIFNHLDVHISAEVNQLQSFLQSQLSDIVDVEPSDDTP